MTSRHTPGWYPDPTGRSEFRYFNGEVWTGDVSVGGNRYVDQLPPGVGAPIDAAGPRSMMPGVPTPSGSGSAARAPWLLAIVALGLSWVPFLFVAAAVAAVVSLALGAARRGRATAEDRSRIRTAMTLSAAALVFCGLGAWLTSIVFREVDRYVDVGAVDAEITQCSVANSTVQIDGTLTNRSETTRSYRIVIDLLRPGTSSRLDDVSVTVEDVAPGEVAPFSVSQVAAADELACELSDISGPAPFGD